MSTRNPERTRGRLLEAAFEEFADHGLSGARVDRIATAAGVNKRMLYHYFGSKEGLFRELLAVNLVRQIGLRRGPARSLAHSLRVFQEDQAAHPRWGRLIMWEALSYGADEIVNAEERTTAWRTAVEGTAAAQAAGALPADLDAAQLQLSLVALVTFPIAFPQLTKMITGHDPADPEFLAERVAFLEKLAARIAGD